MPDEQPCFTIKVTRCGECPHSSERCCLLAQEGRQRMTYILNSDGITPSCPMWAKVQTEPPKD